MSKSSLVIQAEHISLRNPSSLKAAATGEDKKAYLLKDISFELQSGKMLGIVGPNGAGKSSLLKILARLKEASLGRCFLQGVDYSEFSLKQFSQHVAYLEQSPQVAWSLQVEHVINLAFLNKPFSRVQQLEYSERAMRKAEVWQLRHRLVNTLSGGERMRVMMARMFATQSKVFLLDEPLASLDPFYQLSMLNSLKQFVSEGGTVCIVLHDLNHAYSFCDELLLLKDGETYSQGDTHSVLSEHNINQVYGVKSTIHRPQGDSAWIQLSS